MHDMIPKSIACRVRWILGIALIGATIGCRDSSVTPHGIDWTPYELNAESAILESGKCVFVFMYSELSPMSPSALDSLSSTRLKELCPNHDYACFLIKYDEWNDTRVRHIVKSVGHTKKPYVVYFPVEGAPSTYDPVSLTELDLKRDRVAIPPFLESRAQQFVAANLSVDELQNAIHCISGEIQLKENGGNEGIVHVRLLLRDGAYAFWEPPGLLQLKMKLSDTLLEVGDFKCNTTHTVDLEPELRGCKIRTGFIEFSAPIKLKSGIDLDGFVATGSIGFPVNSDRTSVYVRKRFACLVEPEKPHEREIRKEAVESAE